MMAVIGLLMFSQANAAGTVLPKRPIPTPTPTPVLSGPVVQLQQPISPMALTYGQYCLPTAMLNGGKLIQAVCGYYNGTNAQSALDLFTAQFDTSGVGILLSHCGHSQLTGSGVNSNSCPAAMSMGATVQVSGLGVAPLKLVAQDPSGISLVEYQSQNAVTRTLVTILYLVI